MSLYSFPENEVEKLKSAVESLMAANHEKVSTVIGFISFKVRLITQSADYDF